MLRIEFDKQNVARATQLVAKLRGAGDPGAERLRLFTHLGVAVLRWVDQNFASAGSLVGGWKPLAPNTVFGRRKGSDVPLSDTGALRRSFTAAATDEDLRVGTAVQIAKYHQFGTDPYVIRPKKPGGVLAFFGAPMSSLTTRQTRTTLRRKRPGAPNVGLVSARTARLGSTAGRGGRGGEGTRPRISRGADRP